MPHVDVLVIKMIIASKEIKQVYVDNSRPINIIYIDYVEKLGIDKAHLKPVHISDLDFCPG